MSLYVIEIPGSEFVGVRGGIDFYKGRGTTSSKDDAARLASLFGYRVFEQTSESEKIEGGAATPPSVDLSPTPEAVADEAKRKAEREQLVAAEDNPDSKWSQERKAKVRTAGKRRRRKA